jgi:hypothetical protein
MGDLVREIRNEVQYNDDGTTNITRTWLVQYSDTDFAPNLTTLTNLVSVARWDSHPDITECVAKRKSVRMTDIGLWEITVDYDNKTTPADKQEAQDKTQDPTLKPPIFKFGSVKGTKTVNVDTVGNAVVNSAGMPFENGLEIPWCHPTIQITTYKNSFDFTKVSTFVNSINQAAWVVSALPFTFAANTVLCTEYTFSSVFEQNAYYWQVDITLEYDPEGWNPVKILDCGTHTKGEPGGKPQPILSDDGTSGVTSPIPLDGNGEVLDPDAPAEYLPFVPYTEVDFDELL